MPFLLGLWSLFRLHRSASLLVSERQTSAVRGAGWGCGWQVTVEGLTVLHLTDEDGERSYQDGPGTSVVTFPPRRGRGRCRLPFTVPSPSSRLPYARIRER